MLKVKQLVPGRILTRVDFAWNVQTRSREGQISAWLVIGFQEQVKRRHAKMSAPRDGWHVLMLSLGEPVNGGTALQTWHITPVNMGEWKALG